MTPSFRDLFKTFGRIGLMSFGGPAAQIALMEDELVTKRAWLTQDAFLRALSFCMLLPGPEAMQLATYAGWRLRGLWGGLLAGSLFVAPGALVIFVLAALYISYGALPLVDATFLGIQATVIIIVFSALKRLAGKLNGREGLILAALAFVAIFAIGLPFPLIILGAALYGFVTAKGQGDSAKIANEAKPSLLTLGSLAALWAAPIVLSAALGAGFLLTLALFFSQLAVVTFGGAYAVLAYMTQTVVQDLGWITTDQMIDALGLAETTPGPLILVTQFVGVLAGHAIGGWPLAIIAGLVTLWVTFLPCFLWIFAGAPYVERLTTEPRIASALSAVTAAVVGVILNLSLWFALHVIFSRLGSLRFAWAEIPLPALASLNLSAVLYIALAALLLFAIKLDTLRTLLLMVLISGASAALF
ncbi:MAG: chromate efflux transporter [Pseudomonadota bacterium]